MVKKGDWDYIAVPIGAKDTGLSGKYWSDLETLGPRRPRNASNSPSPAAPPSTRSKTSSKSKEAHEPVPIGKFNSLLVVIVKMSAEFVFILLQLVPPTKGISRVRDIRN